MIKATRQKIVYNIKNGNTRFIKKVINLMYRLSNWKHSRSIFLRTISRIQALFLICILKDDYYKVLSMKGNDTAVQAKKSIKTKLLVKFFFIDTIDNGSFSTAKQYSKIIKFAYSSAEAQFVWAEKFINTGRLDLAKITFVNLIENKASKLSPRDLIQAHRELGAVCFMLGQNSDANYYWKLAGQTRKCYLKPTTPTGYRILGSSWGVAIGHIAMLDYYLKYIKLHVKHNVRIVVQLNIANSPNRELWKIFSKLGIVILNEGELENDYNYWSQHNNAPIWSDLSDAERFALVDDFWEYEFPDGEILGYAHAAARIQKEWEVASLPPLFVLSEIEKKWLQSYLLNLGLPKNAWYVCLHVRENGFHKQWNAMYPTIRDADINDYHLAIKTITDAGGWVLRMGDTSMKALTPMPNVIDYASSRFKTPLADILIPAGCRFFLGTNSGYATVPAIYGVPCLLTNWVPMGWPLWPHKDLMMPKLFKYKNTDRLLSLDEIFKSGVAFIQNWSDLPKNLELVSNLPEEIEQATHEMMNYVNSGVFDFNNTENSLAQKYYEQIAIEHGAFTGSKLAKSFTNKYPMVFPSRVEVEASKLIRGNTQKWQLQLNDSTMGTLS